MSGGLPPRTAVSTFSRVLSLLTNSVLTFWPGCCAWYSATRCAKALASPSVYPSHTWIGPDVAPAPDPLPLSVPHPTRVTDAAVSAVSSPARGPRHRCLGIVMPHSARRCSNWALSEHHSAH